jgi:hypothetical protein
MMNKPLGALAVLVVANMLVNILVTVRIKRYVHALAALP